VRDQRRRARVHAALGGGKVQVAGQRLSAAARGQEREEKKQQHISASEHVLTEFYIRSVKHANSS
jgi:hypothetical protein